MVWSSFPTIRTVQGVDIRMKKNDDVVYGTGVVSCPKCNSVRVTSREDFVKGGRKCLKCGHEWIAKKSVLPPFVKKRLGGKKFDDSR